MNTIDEFHCPKCDSDQVLILPDSTDIGDDPDTASYRCLDCGHSGNDAQGDLRRGPAKQDKRRVA